MSPTMSLTLFLKVAPLIDPERPEQKPAPANPRPAKSQTPQDPAASTHAPRQLKPASHTSGPQTKARGSNFDGGPMVPHVKNLNNNRVVVVRPQPAASRTTAVNTITKDDTKPAPTQQFSSGSSTSGTSPSPKKNGRKKKKVCRVWRLSSSGTLTGYNINRLSRRRVRIQQLKQALLHRKVCLRSRARSQNYLCSITWYAR